MKKAILSILVLLLFASCQSNSTKETDNTDSANREKPVDPVEELTLKIRSEPKNPELYFQRSQLYVADKMFLLALEDINRSLKIDSLSSKYHSYKGEIQYFSAKPDLARDSFNKALELDPNNTEALLKLAEIQLLLRNYQECFNLVNTALRIDKQLFMGYFIKGYAHLELGDTSLALSSMQTAVELNPQFYNGYMTLGFIYGAKTNDIAIEYYNSALEVIPGDSEAMYNLALYLQTSDRADDANIVYDKMIELDPASVRAWYNKGYILLELQKKPEEAIPFFTKAIQIFPQYVDAIYNLGLCYERLNRINEARIQYQLALEIDNQYDLAALGMERLQRLK
jgi:tetratricopeptide (TPR) repeat protein